MKEGMKNLSNWQKNIFHMKCDAADSAEGVKGAPREAGKQNYCSRGPCKTLGGLRWRESSGHTPIQTFKELWQPGHSHTGLLHSLTHRGITQKRKALLFSLLILVMAYPFFAELRARVSSAELAARPAPGALESRMSCLQGPHWRNSA